MATTSSSKNSNNSEVTYRQLYSSRIPPLHPLRVIAHCDIDAAYAQFEQVRLNIPPEKPLAVQQWRGLIAVNYPARAFGITRHLAFDEALKKCPELICVHVATYAQGEGETEAKYHENPRPETHKVSLDPYRRESIKILKIFSESCPMIEKASIDEAFLDLSIPVREKIVSRYSQHFKSFEDIQSSVSNLSLDDPLPPPPEFDWDETSKSSGSHIIPTLNQPNSTTWSDVAIIIGAEIMAECRKAVFDQLGYTCSAGIASNKMLAKLCSAYKKPDAQTVLRNSAVKEFLRPLEVSKIRFLGGKLGQSLIELLPPPQHPLPLKESESIVRKVGEVWSLSLTQLQDGLGEENGSWVWDIVRGIDKSELEPKTLVKSMMSSKNFRPSISTWDEGIHWLKVLSTDLYARLSEAREVTSGIWPKTIAMHKRDSDYNSTAKQIAFPYTSKLTQDYIFAFGKRLLQEFSIREPNSSSDKPSLGKITSLGLMFQTLERREQGQRGIEGFFAPKQKDEMNAKDLENNLSNDEKNLTSLENDKSKYVTKSELEDESMEKTSTPKTRKVGIVDFFTRTTDQTSKLDKSEGEGADGSKVELDEKNDLKFECDRCKKVLRPDKNVEDRSAELERLKIEHLDQHFARDLWEGDRKGALQKNSNSNKKSSKNVDGKPVKRKGSDDDLKNKNKKKSLVGEGKSSGKDREISEFFQSSSTSSGSNSKKSSKKK